MPRKKKMKIGDKVELDLGLVTSDVLKSTTDEINAAVSGLAYFAHQKSQATVKLWDILKEIAPDAEWDKYIFTYNHKEQALVCTGVKPTDDFIISSKE